MGENRDIDFLPSYSDQEAIDADWCQVGKDLCFVAIECQVEKLDD